MREEGIEIYRCPRLNVVPVFRGACSNPDRTNGWVPRPERTEEWGREPIKIQPHTEARRGRSG